MPMSFHLLRSMSAATISTVHRKTMDARAIATRRLGSSPNTSGIVANNAMARYPMIVGQPRIQGPSGTVLCIQFRGASTGRPHPFFASRSSLQSKLHFRRRPTRHEICVKCVGSLRRLTVGLQLPLTKSSRRNGGSVRSALRSRCARVRNLESRCERSLSIACSEAKNGPACFERRREIGRRHTGEFTACRWGEDDNGRDGHAH